MKEMMKELAMVAAKSAAINFTIGFVFVAGMINKAISKTMAEIYKKEVCEDE